MTGAENTKKDNQDQYLGDFFKRLKFPYVRKWLSGRASPCQGEGREFESRLPLQRKQALKVLLFSLAKNVCSEVLIGRVV